MSREAQRTEPDRMTTGFRTTHPASGSSVSHLKKGAF